MTARSAASRSTESRSASSLAGGIDARLLLRADLLGVRPDPRDQHRYEFLHRTRTSTLELRAGRMRGVQEALKPSCWLPLRGPTMRALRGPGRTMVRSRLLRTLRRGTVAAKRADHRTLSRLRVDAGRERRLDAGSLGLGPALAYARNRFPASLDTLSRGGHSFFVGRLPSRAGGIRWRRVAMARASLPFVAKRAVGSSRRPSPTLVSCSALGSSSFCLVDSPLELVD